ncbi:MAG: hypothetical protein GYA51_07285 [Candidatus Methanofastidiosa archaeon]|jgi:hypothetical protein|nr:hypothetical protein [Candidatus Methanofastidiosa archaeon]
MRRLNLFDLAIIVLVVASLISFSTKYIEKEPVDEYTYTGSQIYSAIRFFDFTDGKGFRYLVKVNGSYTSDYAPFDEQGVIVGTSQGTFLMKLEDGRILTIGGRTAYKEDIASKEIKVTMLNGSAVHYTQKGFSVNDLIEAKTLIHNNSKFLNKYGIIDTTISGNIAIDCKFPNNITNEEELSDKITKEIFYLKDVKVSSSENGIIINISGIGTKDFEKLQSILSPYAPTKYYFSDFKTVVLTDEISNDEVSLIEATNLEGIIGDIHVRI